ncbi:hypothetical protein ACFWUW_13825 [Streptomyces sp. NPDC058655]|uniref:hypothetical protein n=1 Tax=Streptomyces sp. NPDC058655 TaxID=3346577 RepID=UPI003662F6DE
MRIGDTDLGLVAEAKQGTGAASRIALGIGVGDVDATPSRLEALGGSVRGGPHRMPWGPNRPAGLPRRARGDRTAGYGWIGRPA